MIAWRDPVSLAALVLVPALAVFLAWAGRRRARALARFVATSLLPAVAPDIDPRRRTLRAVVVAAAVLCLVVALAGPMWGFRWQEVHREGIDLVVAIDTSRSMLSNDVKPSRLARAKLAVQDLLAQLHGDRVALVAFAGSAFVQCPLTLDYGAVAQSLDAFDVGLIPRGGTALATAIETSLAAFEGREGKHQAVVLITDGEDHEGKVDEASRQAGERGVKIYTVGIGTGEGELIPGESGGFVKDRSGQVVKSRLDEDTLRKIATDTGGVYLHATGAAFDLGELYRDHLSALDKRELASTLERRFEQRFQIPLALAFALLVLEPLIGNRRRPQRHGAWRWRRAARRAGRAPAGGDGPSAPAAHRDGRRKVLASALVVAALGLGWLDPHQRAREANRLYDAGKYDDAVAAYNQALIDHPDSPLLHFNLGDAAYKGGKYEAAATAFEQVPAADQDPGRSARVAYNLGNAKYRLGAAAEDADAKRALTLYGEALAAYRRALGAAPDDEDPKFNYELVAQKLAALKKKLEEQQKQEQPQQQQQQQQAQQDQQKQEQGGQQPDAQEQRQEDRRADAGQPTAQPSPADGESHDQKARDQEATASDDANDTQRQAAQPTAAPSPAQRAAAPANGTQQPADATPPETATADDAAAKEGEMSRQEATALLDAQRDQEVRPEDVVRRLQGAVVAEPAEDW